MMSKMMITCGYDDKDDDLPAAMMKKIMITCRYDDRDDDYLRL